MKIPSNLEKYVIAFHKINEQEYEFYLKDTTPNSIRIQIIPVNGTGKYRGKVNFLIKDKIEAHFAVSGRCFKDPERAVIQALSWFIKKNVKKHIETVLY